MTICLGITANDGIVVAADTLESTDYLKNEKSKVMYAFGTIQMGQPESRPRSAALICGAGDSGYVESLQTRLVSVFLDNQNVTGDELRDEFEGCLKDFYRAHIIPFATYPSRDRPDVEMLIAANSGHHLSLWISEKTTVRRGTLYKAIGVGSTLAEIMLGRLWKPMNVDAARMLAAYVVFMVKESVEGCGKFTTIDTLHAWRMAGSILEPPQNVISHVPGALIREWEELFATSWAKTEQDTIWNLITQSILQMSKGSP
jgi:hypothetical protein